MEPETAFRLLKYGLWGIGGLFAAIGLRQLVAQYLRYARFVGTNGRIVDVQSEQRWTRPMQSGGPAEPKTKTTVYMAVIEFEAGDGTRHRVTDILASINKPSIGQPVPVRYDPNNPDDAFVSTTASAWVPSLAFLGIGILLLLLSRLAP